MENTEVGLEKLLVHCPRSLEQQDLNVWKSKECSELLFQRRSAELMQCRGPFTTPH